MPDFGNWLQAWRAADQAAMRATRATAVKSMLALDRRGEPPSAEETAEVRRLRALANSLLEHGVSAITAAR